MSHQLSALEQRIAWTRGLRETDKAVLTALARWFAWRSDGANLRPSIHALVTKSGVPKRSVDRALRRLEARGWIEVTDRCHRGPTTYRICVERLAEKDPDAMNLVESHAELSPPCAPEWRAKPSFERHSGAQDESGAQENAPEIAKVARKTSAAVVRTAVLSTSTDLIDPPAAVLERHSGAQDADVAPLVAWLATTHPTYHDGAALTLGRDDTRLLREVLQGRTLERVQAMTILLWTITADANPRSHRSWIAGTDRSLRVLRHKAAFLDRMVAGLVPTQQLTLGPLIETVDEPSLSREEIQSARLIHVRQGGCPHTPEHTREEWHDCVRQIALARKVS